MKKNGYTLVELVTTILILGIITLIAIPVVSIQLKNSRRNTFSMSCEKIFGLDEKYEMVEELLGEENECVVFDFDKNVSERQEINGEIYEPISSLGLQNTDGFVGQYRLCKGKKLLVTNGEFTCVYDTNNKKILDTNSLVVIPVLSSVSTDPQRTSIEVSTDTVGNIKNYYYKIDDKEYKKVSTSSYTFEDLKPETDYKISVYVEDKNGIKSDIKTVGTRTGLEYHGVPEKEYEPGEPVIYDDLEWLVVSDNDDTVTLITKYNVKEDKFGDTASWETSSVKNYLNNEFVNLHKKIKYDIGAGAILFDMNNSNSYVRLIDYNSELNNTLKNGSGTPFWTMTVKNDNVYYADKNANKAYTHYNVTSRGKSQAYYGTSRDLAKIRIDCNRDSVSTKTNTPFLAKPTETSVLIETTKSENKLTAYTTYSIKQIPQYETCNCRYEECNCTTYSCTITNTTYNNKYGSDCTASHQEYACTQSGCVSSNYEKTGQTSCSRTSCGNYSCGKGETCQRFKEDKGHYNEVCKTTTNYCVKYCDKSCDASGLVCKASGCINGYNYDQCDGYKSSVTSTETKIQTTKTTCQTCSSLCYKCDTCVNNVPQYEASGSTVQCLKYTIAETTDVIGIRAVITVKKQRSKL